MDNQTKISEKTINEPPTEEEIKEDNEAIKKDKRRSQIELGLKKILVYKNRQFV